MASWKPHPAELRERAVAMVFELRAETGECTWLDRAVGHRLGINTETLRNWAHVDDTKRAVDAGVSAISVSNHGGNNLNGTPATIRLLPDIARVVGDRSRCCSTAACAAAATW